MTDWLGEWVSVLYLCMYGSVDPAWRVPFEKACSARSLARSYKINSSDASIPEYPFPVMQVVKVIILNVPPPTPPNLRPAA